METRTSTTQIIKSLITTKNNSESDEKVSNNPIDSYWIPQTEFTIGHELGEGYFSKIYKATWQKRQIAVKQVLYNFTPSGKKRELIALNELKILKYLANLKSPYFTKFHGYSKYGLPEKMYYQFLLDFEENGDLTAFLYSFRPDWNVKLEYAKAITKGVIVLHEQKIVHSDLKGKNILLDAAGNIKICDFGLSNFGMSKGGTCYYAAPEFFLGHATTYASDVFSLGMIFYEMTKVGRITDMDKSEYEEFIKSGKRLDMPADCPLKIAEIIDGCWRQPQISRLTAPQVLEKLNAITKEDLKNFCPADYPFLWKEDLRQTEEVLQHLSPKPKK